MVDDDGSGFLIYTSLAQAHSISIAPLSPDFTESLPAQNTDFLPGTDHTSCFEAPALFKRAGVYYATVSVCSCFGKAGADVWVYTSLHPLGPYTRRADLGNAEHSQQNYVFIAPLTSGETAYVWTGDRWKSTPDGQKAHDFQYWQPLNFTSGGELSLSAAHSAPAVHVDLPAAEGVAGVFAKCSKCVPPDPVYWLRNGSKTLHHIHGCNMCGRNLCSKLVEIAPAQFKSEYTVGSEFSCA